MAAVSAHRMPLVWSAWLRPAGLLIGGVASRNWVEVGPDLVRASFGPLGWAEVPLTSVRSAGRRDWPLWYGYGIRYYGREAVAFVGRREGVVELVIDPPARVRAVLERRVRRLALSPEDPDRLLALLGVPQSPPG